MSENRDNGRKSSLEIGFFGEEYTLNKFETISGFSVHLPQF
jgi:hypothetical protein